MLTEAVKENPNWARLGIDNSLPKATEPTPSYVCALFMNLVVVVFVFIFDFRLTSLSMCVLVPAYSLAYESVSYHCGLRQKLVFIGLHGAFTLLRIHQSSLEFIKFISP